MTAVAVTVTRTLDRPAGVELMASAAAVEILYMMTPNTIANVSPTCSESSAASYKAFRCKNSAWDLARTLNMGSPGQCDHCNPD